MVSGASFGQALLSFAGAEPRRMAAIFFWREGAIDFQKVRDDSKRTGIQGLSLGSLCLQVEVQMSFGDAASHASLFPIVTARSS